MRERKFKCGNCKAIWTTDDGSSLLGLDCLDCGHELKKEVT